MNRHLITLALLIGTGTAWAQSTPVGLWKTHDEATHSEKLLVRVSEQDGTLVAVIEKMIDPGKQDLRCDKCTDDRKGRPLQGLTLLRHARSDAADPSSWAGGEILDPASGKVYQARLRPLDGGRRLEVRASIGPLSRTQVWTRVE
jgi:uncharacterized protein (DUF2147 family)